MIKLTNLLNEIKVEGSIKPIKGKRYLINSIEYECWGLVNSSVVNTSVVNRSKSDTYWNFSRLNPITDRPRFKIISIEEFNELVKLGHIKYA